MPLHALPSDVTTVIHDFCGTRELGYSLGCCAKAWRPTDAVWKRLASRHPLTRLAVKHVSSDFARWSAALRMFATWPPTLVPVGRPLSSLYLCYQALRNRPARITPCVSTKLEIPSQGVWPGTLTVGPCGTHSASLASYATPMGILPGCTSTSSGGISLPHTRIASSSTAAARV